MRRLTRFLLPLIIMVVFVLLMVSDEFVKRPFHGELDDVSMHLLAVRQAVLSEDWKVGSASLENLRRAWGIVTGRVQFTVERDEIRHIDSNIARLSGFLDGEEQAGALAELAELEEHWTQLGR